MVRDLLVAVWFVVAGAAFFAPYLGWPLPTGATTAVYAAFLIGGIVTVALRFVRPRGGA